MNSRTIATALSVIVAAVVVAAAPASAAGKKGTKDPAPAPAAASNDDVLDKPVEKAPPPSDDSSSSSSSDEAKPASSDAGKGEGAPQPGGPVEETVYVVQGKPFLAKGKFEISPQVAQSVNDSFTSHTGVLVSGLYH